MRKSKRSNTKKKRSKTPAKRARKYIVKSLFGGDKAAADAWVKKNANKSSVRAKNYERVRTMFSPGMSKEELSHSLWMCRMKARDDRRRSAIQKHRKKGNSRTRLPSAFADTEKNAFPLLIRRQDGLQSIPTNQTFGLL